MNKRELWEIIEYNFCVERCSGIYRNCRRCKFSVAQLKEELMKDETN